MNSPPQDQSKKAYTAPVMHVYGDIRALTQSFGNTGNLDGGAEAGFTKTAAP